jgi:hypothetical protein
MNTLYQRIDQSKNWSSVVPNADGSLNFDLFGTKVPIYECPSNPEAGKIQDGSPPPDTPVWQARVANGDYAGFYGVAPQLFTLGLVDESSVRNNNGGLSKTDRLKFSSFTDGTSNTIRLVESAGRPHVYRLGRKVIDAPAGSSIRVNGGGWCRPASELNLLIGASADGVSYPGPRAINVTNGIPLGSAYPDPYFGVDGTGQPYSFHTGGNMAAFVDGSGRFLNSDIDIRVFARLISRDGGETQIDIGD